MNSGAALQVNHDKVAGFAAAVALHCLALYGAWQFQFAPPRSEAPAVFVSLVDLAQPVVVVKATRLAEPVAPKRVPVVREAARQAAPIAPQPAAVRQEPMKQVAPVAPRPLSGTAAVNAPTGPDTPPAPAVKAPQARASVDSPASSGPVSTPLPAVKLAQPVLQADELSVSCTDRTPPAYPRLSTRLGEQGKTVLLVELDEHGRVARVTVKTGSGFPHLDQAAVSAVQSWRCTPARRNGVAVRSYALQPFNFALKGH